MHASRNRSAGPGRHGPGSPLARVLKWVLLSATAFGSASTAQAADPPLGAIVVDWTQGRYLSPVICEVDGTPIRGGRRFRIESPERPGAGWGLRLHFDDLDAAEATRCYDDLGRVQSNLVGVLDLAYRGTSRPGMVLRDFRERMKRDRGFEFAIRGAALKVEAVGSGEGERAAARAPVFRGGTATIRLVRPGSDEDRLLSGLRSDRRVVLEIEPRSGAKLRIPAVRLHAEEAPRADGHEGR